MNPINERMKSLRLALGLTQEKMAALVGLTKGGISQMEQDQRPVSARHVKMLVLMFGVNESWIWTGEGDMLLDRKAALRVSLIHQWQLSPAEANMVANFVASTPELRKSIFDSFSTLNHWLN